MAVVQNREWPQRAVLVWRVVERPVLDRVEGHQGPLRPVPGRQAQGLLVVLVMCVFVHCMACKYVYGWCQAVWSWFTIVWCAEACYHQCTIAVAFACTLGKNGLLDTCVFVFSCWPCSAVWCLCVCACQARGLDVVAREGADARVGQQAVQRGRPFAPHVVLLHPGGAGRRVLPLGHDVSSGVM